VQVWKGGGMKKSETGLLGGTPKKLLSLEILLKILFPRPWVGEQNLACSPADPYAIRAKLLGEFIKTPV